MNTRPSSPEAANDPALSRLPALLSAAAAGLLFAAGLAVSGMTQPAKVISFLNLGGIATGQWDPSLAFVMGGALLVTLIAFAVTPSHPKHPARQPWFAKRFQLPTRQDIDTRLLLGSALFGIGWGLAGYCPGPALSTVLSGGLDTVAFVAAMLAGMAVARRWLR
ncbi:MAG: YeeE/YedE family protein [Curvibacter sp.]|nr:MAG: YeeE/YedE family protein [Curvibacter sp.]